jgi:hypothetical protein
MSMQDRAFSSPIRGRGSVLIRGEQCSIGAKFWVLGSDGTILSVLP